MPSIYWKNIQFNILIKSLFLQIKNIKNDAENTDLFSYSFKINMFNVVHAHFHSMKNHDYRSYVKMNIRVQMSHGTMEGVHNGILMSVRRKGMMINHGRVLGEICRLVVEERSMISVEVCKKELDDHSKVRA